MINTVNALLRSLKTYGDIGFYAQELKGARTVELNAHDLYFTASCFKVITAIAVYHKLESEGLRDSHVLRLTERNKSPGSGLLKNMKPMALSIYNLVYLMLKVSDNTATDILLNFISVPYQSIIVKALGLKKTRVNNTVEELCAGEFSNLKKMTPKDYDAICVKRKGIPPKNAPSLQLSKGNVSTPFEMAKVLEELLNPKLISKRSANKIVQMMKAYDADDRILEFGSYIEIASKAGWMSGIRSDVGIVFAEKPFLYALMGKGLQNDQKLRLISSTNDILKMAVKVFS